MEIRKQKQEKMEIVKEKEIKEKTEFRKER
jgi:hypothetical protein